MGLLLLVIAVCLFAPRGDRIAAPQPTAVPTEVPTAMPTEAPTPVPTEAPTPSPTIEPTQMPTESPEPETREILITAVGDCTLGGDNAYGLEDRFRKYYDQYGADYFLSGVRALFESDDLTIVNLEGPLTTSRDKREGRKFNFRGDPEYVKILSGSSVEIANIANNHAYDYGETGFEETARTLEDAGICASGFARPGFVSVKGATVGSAGFYDKDHSLSEMVSAVEYMRARCDLLIVSIHWGKEYTHEPTDEQRKIGHALIDAGADLVIGNHSHVYGGLEMYKGKYIIYSLGNFCFGGNRNPDDKRCIIFQQSFGITEGGEIADAGINIIPASISGSSDTNDYQPCILEGDAGISLLKNVAEISNLTLDDTVWMESSYEIQNGIIASNAANDGDLQ